VVNSGSEGHGVQPPQGNPGLTSFHISLRLLFIVFPEISIAPHPPLPFPKKNNKKSKLKNKNSWEIGKMGWIIAKRCVNNWKKVLENGCNGSGKLHQET